MKEINVIIEKVKYFGFVIFKKYFNPNLIIPRLTPIELNAFKEILKVNKHMVYFEYGSGGSTIIAKNIFETIYSMDTDERWVNMLNKKLGREIVMLVNIGEVKEWGFPLVENEINFNKLVHCFDDLLMEEKREKLIFVDGRARLAISLNLIQYFGINDILIIHDFIERPEYYEILKYFKIINIFDSLIILKLNLEIEKEKNQFDFR